MSNFSEHKTAIGLKDCWQSILFSSSGQISDDPLPADSAVLQWPHNVCSPLLISHLSVLGRGLGGQSPNTKILTNISQESTFKPFFSIAALIEFINLSPGGQGAYFHSQTPAPICNLHQGVPQSQERGVMANIQCLPLLRISTISTIRAIGHWSMKSNERK